MNFFRVEEQESYIHIRLARPDKYNALDTAMLREFREALGQVRGSDRNLVLISGEGPGFCAGGDISMMKEFSDEEKYNDLMDDIDAIVTEIYTMPKIVVAALHGATVGLGLSIALSCDYIIAEKESVISMNFIGIGLAPDGGGHYWLKERLGVHHAKQYAWEGSKLSAEEAQKLKLVDMVTSDLLNQAEALMTSWSRRPLQSMIATKTLYHQAGLEELEYYLKQERINQRKLSETKDHQEAVRAFMEKRKPEFKGE
ncbi:enoyl-CoA hydratase [Salimicrobium flavidum]|uniref:Enoyl-CoA hydratase n=1 Tax=Salimicrobium flavidum TaxID=570947 RepID=A0A1N7JD74_9BACI|nr:enoyl-CoA hydratase [Salimicrobium flavidum]SIS47342.1 Enoyl-CoA hydratase [Salimicrobium flavidum]